MLIVEDGTGIANAESLVSVEFADDYHAKRGNAAWAALDLETKEQLLRKANDYFVGIYGERFAGAKYYVNQFLPFPRDKWPGDAPELIKQALAELALIARTTPLMPTITRGKKRVKVGPIDVEYDGNSATSKKFVAASLRIAPFLGGFSSGGPFARLVRV